MSKQNYSRKKKNKKKNSSLIKKILVAILAVIAVIAVFLFGLGIFWIATAPDITEEDMIGGIGATVVDGQNREIYKFGGTDRELVSAEEIPQVLKDAVLAIEDQRFYDHHGVDPIRIGGALVANFRDGFGSQGGSTITQQLVKLSVFSTSAEDQNLKRKVQEAWLALQVERQFSKEEILTLYMNKVYMSDNQYGMGTASEYYYGKPASELALHEAALIAGMPQSPNAYNPYDYPDQALQRRNTVLYAMVDHGVISQAQYEETSQIPIETGLTERSFSTGENIAYDAYIKQVIKEIEEKTDLDPYNSPLRIHTAMDTEAQEFLYNLMHTNNYMVFPDEEFQAAISVVNTQTGAVAALYGGDNDDQALGYNRATELNRSVASAMKPLSVYGPAIEYEHYYTGKLISDSPFTFSDGSELTNFDNQYHGDVTMRNALINSYNIPAARTLQDVGLDRASEFLNRLGIDNLNGGAGLYESNAIGGEVTPMQLSASYAAFGNGGNYTEPYTVTQIETPEGQTIDLVPESVKAMEDYTAYMMTNMLKDTARSYANVSGVQAHIHHGLKTGTTNFTEEQFAQYNIPSDAVPDHWTSGYSQNYSVAVWTGYDDYLTSGNYLSVNDSSLYKSVEIYGNVMNFLHSDAHAMQPDVSLIYDDWVMPESVVQMAIIPGRPPQRANGSRGQLELFVRESLQNIQFNQADEGLKAPANLSARYNASTESIEISWSAVEDADGYIVSMDGQSAETRRTSYSFPYSGSSESISISVSARSGNQTGPAATLNLTLQIEDNDSSDTDSSSSSEEDVPAEEDSSSRPPSSSLPGEENPPSREERPRPGEGESSEDNAA